MRNEKGLLPFRHAQNDALSRKRNLMIPNPAVEYPTKAHTQTRRILAHLYAMYTAIQAIHRHKYSGLLHQLLRIRDFCRKVAWNGHEA